jgi:DNA-binding transcriptional regulator GbsR (MarR family)
MNEQTELETLQSIDKKERTGKERARINYLKHKDYFTTYRNKNKEVYKKYVEDNKEHMKELFRNQYEKTKHKKIDSSLKKYYFKKAWLELLQIDI